MAEEEIKFDVDTQDQECTFVRFLAHNEIFSARNNRLLSYKCAGSTKTFKNPKAGTLRLNRDIFKSDGVPLKQGDVVAWWIGPCKHEVILGNLCATCGSSMAETGFIEDKQSGRAQYVSTVHNVPALVVAIDKAKELSNTKQKQLLDGKKLILLVDLDQTLIHTTNKAPRPNEVGQDIHGFQLQRMFYYTKVRPYTYKFLENMSKLFELHVVTYGQRMYAEQIVRILDPGKIYFASRVLSRDELISANSKSVNLQALFPSGSQLVMMMDDRPDVWENSDALVWIKPYRFFTEVGDINAMNSNRGNDSPVDEETTRVAAQNARETATNNPEGASDADEITPNSNPSANGEETSTGNREQILTGSGEETSPKNGNQSSPNTAAEPSSPDIAEQTSPGNEENPPQTSTYKPPGTLADTDDILSSVERILTDVHSAFFEIYENDQEVRPASEFAANLRKEVLRDEVIVFSGIVPITSDMKSHPLYKCCVRFGAEVADEVTDATTTLIAVKAQTEKYYAAKKRGIPIVTPKWVEECMAYWKKVDKGPFTLKVASEYDQAVNNAFSHMPRLAKDDWKKMQDEVDEELAEISEEESADDDQDTDFQNLSPLSKKPKLQ